MNPNWKTEDDWTNYTKYPSYSTETTYNAGDKCTQAWRIWTATATTKGVRPYKQVGQIDSLERVEEWIRGRLTLLDEYFSYDPDGMNVPAVDNTAETLGIFDLQGRRLSSKPARGIYIEDGKKKVK